MAQYTRIVTLGAELPEILEALHVAQLVVGVSGFTRRPAWARQLPKVGGFVSPNLETIRQLQPDLVISTSHLQHAMVGQLASEGYSVFYTNPTSLNDVQVLIERLASLLDADDTGRLVVAQWRERIYARPTVADRIRIHFEEWGDPIMAPIPWVAELLQLAGAELAFPELSSERFAKDRIVTPDAIASRSPDAVLASWCGRRVDLEKIQSRPGMAPLAPERIRMVPSDLFLQPGLNLMQARDQLDQLLRGWST